MILGVSLPLGGVSVFHSFLSRYVYSGFGLLVVSETWCVLAEVSCCFSLGVDVIGLWAGGLLRSCTWVLILMGVDVFGLGVYVLSLYLIGVNVFGRPCSGVVV